MTFQYSLSVDDYLNFQLYPVSKSVNTVSDRRGRESQKSKLIFYLDERQQKFYLTANIGKAYQNEQFRKILAGINQADTLSVWVDKDEVDEYEPTVFQIDNQHKTLLEFEKVRRGGSPVVIVCLVFGIATILGFLWFRYPRVLDRMWN